MKDLLNFIIEKALILIPVLSVIGTLLKATPKFPNWLIPYILLICGVSGSVSIIGLSAESVFQGVLVTGAAVFGYEAYKSFNEATGGKQ